VIIFEFKLKKYGANQSKLHEDYLEMLFYDTKNILLFVDLKFRSALLLLNKNSHGS